MSCLRILAAIAYIGCSQGVRAEQAESLSFQAEHLLEAPMDARYLAFPQLAIDSERSESRFQAGYNRLNGVDLNNEVALVSLHYATPQTDDCSWLFGVFYDAFQFSGQRGPAFETPEYVSVPTLPAVLPVDVFDVSGNGAHYGLSAAWNYRLVSQLHVFIGLALETLNIHRFQVDFRTRDQPENYIGKIDYAADYPMYSPFGGLEWRGSPLFGNWYHAARILIVLPRPRVGFEGQISGPEFSARGETEEFGHGAHIPDGYMAINYTLEHQPSGIRIDLGGPVHYYISEPPVHEGIDKPLFLTASFRF